MPSSYVKVSKFNNNNNNNNDNKTPTTTTKSSSTLQQQLSSASIIILIKYLFLSTMAAKAKKIEELELQLSCLIEDIDDHLDESPLNSFIVVDDVDTAVTKAESLRSQFRSEHQQLKKLTAENYDDDYNTKYSDELQKIKDYITAAKGAKQKLRITESNAKTLKESQ